MNFHGKVAVITGGGSGIGKATAIALARQGAKVVINGRREQVLLDAAGEIDSTGERVLAIAGDIRQLETSASIVKAAVDRFGGIDVLISSTGIFKPTPFLEHTETDFYAYVDTIVKGSFFIAQAVIPEMIKRGGGAIVHVGSMWATQAIGATPSSAYSAAMAGRHALTRNLAIEFANERIRVNAVAPAIVETPVYESFVPQEQMRSVLDSFNAFHPLGRIGQPQDMVSAILFLASDEASWITGAILPVDGGVTAGKH
ncbi:SDR family NAD(P)-dependent oxidoreductase [Paenibacillus methanolicus]|uniref:NAD(P)-dependent dehydrogenase (Short-subunit alcohol dehydrogenase family) n=1 Tax=Paenibacillus methanolicus TaxID=582686 RepID=A0A5S5BRD4_9BACL|nr:SDR family oxidoreductase [Paenibacillus methanolicus]TYP69547.1 NAD(P)-dependent dehydrogenase (short-subunit alcohol dehydrogenase family) [Paenibacillus methanolicus]